MHTLRQRKKERKRKINQDAENLSDSSPDENFVTNIPKEKKIKNFETD
jgi:hypothetical protein